MTKTAKQYAVRQAEAVGAPPPPGCDEQPGTDSKHTGARGPPVNLLDDTITDAEIADAYGVHIQTVRRWAALGRLPPPVGPGERPIRRNLKAVKRAIAGIANAA